MDKYVGEWRPHRPRGPIMAHFHSPGPKYMLPGSTGFEFHDLRKMKNPAYSFGGRLKAFDGSSASPGPVYKIPQLITRHGKDGTPIYTLKSRLNDLSVLKVPGPGTYSPEKSGPAAQRTAPCYSLHGRTKLAKTDHSPGPNAYFLPQITKSMERPPAYSMTGKTRVGGFSEDLARSPGPATYQITAPKIYKRRDPMYSMTGRNHPPDGWNGAPGPGAHRPEKVYLGRRIAPRYSFGTRHSDYIAPLMV